MPLAGTKVHASMFEHSLGCIRRFLLLAMVLVAGVAPLAPAGAGARYLPDDDATLISRTVREISRLDQERNGHELYDWLSLASRELIAREAFVAWVETEDRFRPVADPQILDVTMEEWTWPLTGGVYPQIARVELAVQGVQDGVAVSTLRTWHFQFDPDAHRWRWLFPVDRDLLHEIQDVPVPALSFASPFADEGYLSIDEFWAGILAETDIPYQGVRSVIAVTEQPVVTGCGVESDIEQIGIYTCLLDQTIYYSPQLRNMLEAQFGETGWHLVIAHEWSHQVQAMFGIRYGTAPELDGGRYILELESQADCLMGIYVQAAVGAGTLSRADFMLARRLLGTYGDYAGMPWDSTNAHGDATQRIAAFDAGYFSGFVGCGLDLDNAAEPVATPGAWLGDSSTTLQKQWQLFRSPVE